MVNFGKLLLIQFLCTFSIRTRPQDCGAVMLSNGEIIILIDFRNVFKFEIKKLFFVVLLRCRK